MSKWQTISRRTVHHNRYFDVVEEKFLLPGGESGTYYILELSDFVAVVAREGDSIFLVEMERYTLKKKMLELPMGGIEGGEKPLAAAKRELREETGITARKWKKIGRSESFKGRSAQRFTVFVAEDLRFGEQELDPVESAGGAKLVKKTVREVEELIRRGCMTDAHTLAAFQLFMLDYRDSK